MNEQLPEMKSFVLPGGHTTVSFCHLARCVCRRAENMYQSREQYFTKRSGFTIPKQTV